MTGPGFPPQPRRILSFVPRASAAFGLFALSMAVLLAVWYGVIRIYNLSPYFAKSPADVWSYLVSGPQSSQHLESLLGPLGVTLEDAALGYAAGTVAALLVSISVVLSAAAERSILPVSIAIRSVPLVAMTPLVTLSFGRGLLAVTILVSVITFFPTVVNVTTSMKSMPVRIADTLTAYGGTEWTVMRKARLPFAVPGLLASARIAVPAAILGALLAEWLATGNGIGYLMLTSSATSMFTILWSATVLVTGASILLYLVVNFVESLLADRFSAGELRR